MKRPSNLGGKLGDANPTNPSHPLHPSGGTLTKEKLGWILSKVFHQNLQPQLYIIKYHQYHPLNKGHLYSPHFDYFPCQRCPAFHSSPPLPLSSGYFSCKLDTFLPHCKNFNIIIRRIFEKKLIYVGSQSLSKHCVPP